MSDLYAQLFSPLGKEYCDYFKYLMIISFIMLIGTILGCLYDAFSKERLWLRAEPFCRQAQLVWH